jgi:hypothetical protein
MSEGAAGRSSSSASEIATKAANALYAARMDDADLDDGRKMQVSLGDMESGYHNPTFRYHKRHTPVYTGYGDRGNMLNY